METLSGQRAGSESGDFDAETDRRVGPLAVYQPRFNTQRAHCGEYKTATPEWT
jgi:hypothetical protein